MVIDCLLFLLCLVCACIVLVVDWLLFVFVGGCGLLIDFCFYTGLIVLFGSI